MIREEVLKRAKPILFNTDMVRAILDSRKTVTRRVLKLQKHIVPDDEGTYTLFADGAVYEKQHMEELVDYLRLPYQPGDILYVRETFKRNMDGYSGIDFGGYIYKADCRSGFKDNYNPWHPSIHMPKEAARIFLKVKDVRVERLQDITSKEMEREGLTNPCEECYAKRETCEDCICRDEYVDRLIWSELWNSTIKKKDMDRYGWDANPWVWVIEFEKMEVE